jgi:hypothetical protein
MLEILISLFIYRLISDRFVDIDPRFWKAVGEGVIEIIYDVSSGISHLIPVASCRCIAEEDICGAGCPQRGSEGSD